MHHSNVRDTQTPKHADTPIMYTQDEHVAAKASDRQRFTDKEKERGSEDKMDAHVHSAAALALLAKLCAKVTYCNSPKHTTSHCNTQQLLSDCL